MTILKNAQSYDWNSWMIGIMRSFLSGGAVALATLSGGALVGVTPDKMWKMVGINFLAMGAYRMGEFLQLHGAPDKVVMTEKTVDVQPAGDGIKATTITKTVTSTEPPTSSGSEK